MSNAFPQQEAIDVFDKIILRSVSFHKSVFESNESKPKCSQGFYTSLFDFVLPFFCFLMILSIPFAGMSSKTSSPVSFQGSPVSARATEGGLISVQYYAFPSASEPDGPGSGSPKYVYCSYWLSNYVPFYVFVCFVL